jgi:hypothetical protein
VRAEVGSELVDVVIIPLTIDVGADAFERASCGSGRLPRARVEGAIDEASPFDPGPSVMGLAIFNRTIYNITNQAFVVESDR